MISKTIMIPDLNLGVVVLTNTWMDGAGVFASVIQTIIDSYLGLEDFDWVDAYYQGMQSNQREANSVVTQVWATVKSAKISKSKMKNYVGTYEDNWFGKVEILLKEGSLYFRSHRSPKLSGPMAFYNGNSFAIKWTPPDIDFSYDFHYLNLVRVEE